MTLHIRRARGVDYGPVVTLTALAIIGLIPWVSVAFGGEPAFSAALGAAVTIGSLFLLVPAVRDLRAKHTADDAARPSR